MPTEDPSENRIVYNCPCGQKLAAPGHAAGMTIPCPKCGGQTVVPGEPPAPDRADSVVGRLCSVCRTTIGHGEQQHVCPGCASPFHKECWDEIGGCATYGCEFMPAADKSDGEAGGATNAWGDDKTCPICGKELRSSAVLCRFCKTRFPTTAPMTPAEFHDWRTTQSELGPARTIAFLMFFASIIGIFAPLILPAGGAWIYFRHKTLRRVGGATEVLAYGALLISMMYCIILVFAFVVA